MVRCVPLFLGRPTEESCSVRRSCPSWEQSIHTAGIFVAKVKEGSFIQLVNQIQQGQDQREVKPVARLQPTTGVMSHIFTTRSLPHVTIRPLEMSMDIWEILCFPS